MRFIFTVSLLGNIINLTCVCLTVTTQCLMSIKICVGQWAYSFYFDVSFQRTLEVDTEHPLCYDLNNDFMALYRLL